LGLSLVKEIVEMHGGKVWAESLGKDQGATFFVALPIVQE
jgi:signal transduction histidine kinase